MFKQKQLFLLIGGIASGKSTFAKNFAAYYQPPRNLIVLSSDLMRGVIGTGEEDQSVSSKVFDNLRWNTEYLFKNTNYDVMIDATNKKPRDRAPFLNIAKKYNASVTCFFFTAPLELCIARNNLRSRKVPEDIVRRFHATVEEPISEYDGMFDLYHVNEDGFKEHRWSNYVAVA